jgi:hypothetical protein
MQMRRHSFQAGFIFWDKPELRMPGHASDLNFAKQLWS